MPPKGIKQMEERHIKWHPPVLSYFKINTDGASLGNPGPAGAGGIIRDCNGIYVKAFCRKLGVASNTTAELWAIRDGLKIALDLGLSNRVLIESDSTTAIHLIEGSFNCSHPNAAIINDCRWLMMQLGINQVLHTYREGNQVVDLLSKQAVHQEHNFCLFNSAPSFISSQLLADCMGVSYPRTLNVGNMSLNSFEGVVDYHLAGQNNPPHDVTVT
ncbi:hypothetical protein CCACVL1_24654 [Corchorus capsularis]|uniref:RNase H type-1 domain-containing protein n=1 Tax=Corchorus capsularis TaxID=210143 RepID=A0A1R3GNM4_COCAP|nr:hypothetical protein CCACVL1_24654 [Corchorus capsularis]